MKRVFISWDIDGTLLIGTGGIHQHAFRTAISELYRPCGIPAEVLGTPMDGWMDKGIAIAVIEKLGFEATEEGLLKVKALMEEHFAESAKNERFAIPKGVPEMLELLANQENVTMGLASGNFERIAWTKLGLVDLAKYFPERIGGLGVYVNRRDAIIAAKRMAEEKTGKTFDIWVHVGDTPNDSQAAADAGAIPFIVETGIHWDKFGGSPIIVKNLDEGKAVFLETIGLGHLAK